jgi:cysteine desulfurase / selenocysteine lyase
MDLRFFLVCVDGVHSYEEELTTHLFRQLATVPTLRIYGPQPQVSRRRAALAAFTYAGLHAHDLSTMLDQDGIAIRSGHHCTQPLHRAVGAAATARASLYFYNTTTEIDQFVQALKDAIAFFGEG